MHHPFRNPGIHGFPVQRGTEVFMFELLQDFAVFFMDGFKYISSSTYGNALLFILLLAAVAELFWSIAGGF